ncbi:unnamed protein product [Owenia fusiformis]|uniref:CP-type G domain-containing protein n=1 Tax=Owenia fusiformis TaxID=6347 RepID=A0A8S4NP64_OWEFU|nr:unnamed protein product [Owenia fusiformis]
MKQFFKKKSKRTTTRKLKKIEKKVREHHKKLRKDAKKNPKKTKKKDPGIPNSAPFKEQVLKEAEERKIKLEDERLRNKEKQKKARQKQVAKKRNLSSMILDAQKRQKEFEKQKAATGEANDEANKPVETSRKAFYKEFRKVVDAADVVLQVLDARDPLGSRCVEVEQAILDSSAKKKLVLVLNKIDLVPRENVEKWLKYLRNEFPAVAFKASTQKQTDNLSQAKINITSQKLKGDTVKTSKCLGADVLMKLLGNYCRNQNIKTSVTVGIVGFPNTGKSSIINSLKRSKACNVGAMPGVTKQMQEIQLDKHVKLLDSPGIVMATGDSNSSVILRNCVKVETVEDPITPVQAILNRCSKEKMMLHYNITDYSSVTDFLGLLAKRLGRLKKGGVPDVFRAAKTVLQDWNTGRITYYTQPPETQQTGNVSIVQEMSQAFDIDALLSDEQDTLKGLKQATEKDFVLVSGGPTSALETPCDDDEMGDDNTEEDDEDEDMEDDNDDKELKDVTVGLTPKLKANKSAHSLSIEKAKKKAELEAALDGNQQLIKDRKKKWKHIKKSRKKADKVAGSLSNALEGAMDILGTNEKSADSYNFSTDFK